MYFSTYIVWGGGLKGALKLEGITAADYLGGGSKNRMLGSNNMILVMGQLNDTLIG